MAFKDFVKGFGAFFTAFTPARVAAAGKSVASRALADVQNLESHVLQHKATPLPKESAAPPTQDGLQVLVDPDLAPGHFDEIMAPTPSIAWNRSPGTQPITILPDVPYMDATPMIAIPTPATDQPAKIERSIPIVVPIPSGAVAPPSEPIAVPAPVVPVAPSRIQPWTGVPVFGKNVLLQ